MTKEGPIYFLHIPKTGGSSVTALLRREFGERLCPHQLWDHIADLEVGALSKYQAFAGHFGLGLSDKIRRKVRAFTFLRNPVARTLSHFLHVKRDTNHPYYEVTRAMDLREFLLHPITQPLIYNFQARQFVKRARPEYFVDRVRHAGFSRGFLSVTCEAASYGCSESEIRAAAMEGMEHLDYVGVTDKMDQCIVEMASVMGVAENRIDQENTSSNREILGELDSDLVSLIEDLTTVDREIYESALAICGSRTLKNSDPATDIF